MSSQGNAIARKRLGIHGEEQHQHPFNHHAATATQYLDAEYYRAICSSYRLQVKDYNNDQATEIE